MKVYLPLENRAPKPSNHTRDHRNPSKPRFPYRIRHVIRCKHYNIRSELAYVEWMTRNGVIKPPPNSGKTRGQVEIPGRLAGVIRRAQWPADRRRLEVIYFNALGKLA